jgi:hypothetical protein
VERSTPGFFVRGQSDLPSKPAKGSSAVYPASTFGRYELELTGIARFFGRRNVGLLLHCAA